MRGLEQIGFSIAVNSEYFPRARFEKLVREISDNEYATERKDSLEAEADDDGEDDDINYSKWLDATSKEIANMGDRVRQIEILIRGEAIMGCLQKGLTDSENAAIRTKYASLTSELNKLLKGLVSALRQNKNWTNEILETFAHTVQSYQQWVAKPITVVAGGVRHVVFSKYSNFFMRDREYDDGSLNFRNPMYRIASAPTTPPTTPSLSSKVCTNPDPVSGTSSTSTTSSSISTASVHSAAISSSTASTNPSASVPSNSIPSSTVSSSNPIRISIVDQKVTLNGSAAGVERVASDVKTKEILVKPEAQSNEEIYDHLFSDLKKRWINGSGQSSRLESSSVFSLADVELVGGVTNPSIRSSIAEYLNDGGKKAKSGLVVRKLDEKYPVKALHGQKSLWTTRDFAKFEVLEYEGRWSTEDRLRYLERSEQNSHLMAYSFGSIPIPTNDPVKRRLEKHDIVPALRSAYIVDGFYGPNNDPALAAHINDFRFVTHRLDHAKNIERSKLINCSFVNAMVKGTPKVFVYFLKATPANTELLINYGTQYWQNLLTPSIDHGVKWSWMTASDEIESIVVSDDDNDDDDGDNNEDGDRQQNAKKKKRKTKRINLLQRSSKRLKAPKDS
jgi:hypothetical protein